jgi:hypothetical protein
MKVEGKSRNAIWVHVNAAPLGTQAFTSEQILKNGESKNATWPCGNLPFSG